MRQYSQKDKQKYTEDFHKSGLNQKGWCKQNHFLTYMLCKWLKEEKNTRTFVEVIEYDLSDEEKICEICGQELTQMM